MTNLLISYPDIPFRAQGIIPSAAADDDYPTQNLISGPKHGQFRFANLSNPVRVMFDLGPNVTAEADHCIIGRADILCVGSGITGLEVQYSSDGGSWTNAVAIANLPAETRRGPFFQDYITTFSTTPARRYQAIYMTHAATSKFQMSKCYIGKFFDFGKDPIEWSFQRSEARRSTWESASGAQHHCRATWPRYEGRGVWTGISDSKTADFMEKIARFRRRNFVWLYTASDHSMLESQRLVYCRVVDVRRTRNTQRTDWNDLEVTFSEVLE